MRKCENYDAWKYCKSKCTHLKNMGKPLVNKTRERPIGRIVFEEHVLFYMSRLRICTCVSCSCGVHAVRHR
jgi:hypothetical protein